MPFWVCVAVVDTASTSYRQLSEKVTPLATALAASLQERFDRQQGRAWCASFLSKTGKC